MTRGAEPADRPVGNLPPMRADIESREVTTPGGRKAGVIAFNLWMGLSAGPSRRRSIATDSDRLSSICGNPAVWRR